MNSLEVILTVCAAVVPPTVTGLLALKETRKTRRELELEREQLFSQAIDLTHEYQDLILKCKGEMLNYVREELMQAQTALRAVTSDQKKES